MKLKFAIALTLLAATAVAAQKAKSLYKVSKLSDSQVGVSCVNGADPTVRRIGDLLVVACEYAKDSGPLGPAAVAAR